MCSESEKKLKLISWKIKSAIITAFIAILGTVLYFALAPSAEAEFNAQTWERVQINITAQK
jgi:hypothetical protein